MCIATSLATALSRVGGDQDADLRRQVRAVGAGSSRHGASMRATRRISIFSPIVALASMSSRGPSCPARSRCRAASRRPSPRSSTAWSSDPLGELDEGSPLATKSVSQLISTRVPTPPSTWRATRPCTRCGPPAWRPSLALDAQELDRPCRGCPRPRSSAFLQSIIPAPVWSRSALTSAAV